MTPPDDRGPSYRSRVSSRRLASFHARVQQTDLFIRAEKDLTGQTLELILAGRKKIEDWIAGHPEFLTSLSPQPVEVMAVTPVKEMLVAGARAGVGPMAAVAGAMAEYVGRGLAGLSTWGIVVENGGDLYIRAQDDVVVGLFAGSSILSMRLGLVIKSGDCPVGVATSSGTVGHSLSFGRADAATVIAANAALSDAVATALGNRVQTAKDIDPALEWALSIEGVTGAVVILSDKIGFLGDLTITPIK